MSHKYAVSTLCAVMGVNRSGYYKWKSRQGSLNRYEQDRKLLTELINEVHVMHKAFGYHGIATQIRKDTGWLISDNLVHKCCKQAGIRSQMKHYRYKKSGEEHILFPNRIRGHWAAEAPMEIVVSDMTCIPYHGKLYEWTYLLDTFNNEIISSHISGRQNDRKPYFECLEDLKEKMKEQKDPLVLHTDQGSVYSSRAFSDAHKDYTIIRSMSRAGTPTDNPIIESLNGWIKAELRLDFPEKNSTISAKEYVDAYVNYFNNERPAYALEYKTPVQYRIERGFG